MFLVDSTLLRVKEVLTKYSTFTAGSYEFASFLFCGSPFRRYTSGQLIMSVIEVFKDTLVPASLVGLMTKLAGLIFSGYMGGLVDHYPRLSLIRSIIAAEKVCEALVND